MMNSRDAKVGKTPRQADDDDEQPRRWASECDDNDDLI